MFTPLRRNGDKNVFADVYLKQKSCEEREVKIYNLLSKYTKIIVPHRGKTNVKSVHFVGSYYTRTSQGTVQKS